ncbi:metallophosphoesterase family protein [Candidatus Accumulibacter sp. ACC003]|uniref:metallophosphoesterase family protein n=1 Tax=Candidatus Accumulibacter sp. ACC003 TaxID=2823334 RepID=UPI0025C6E409|nr:metallophosphoesterase family protein [Candidatus Accumulibacter sp. ACC003]
MIGIISDIHGSHVALAAVLARLDEMAVSEIICLGDIGGYYCQVNECCEELRSRNIFSLMGNHDWYLATGETCPRSASANRCLDYQRRILAETNRSWLQSLKPRADIGALSIVHGGWNDPLDEYVVPSVEYFSCLEGRFFASGHTHVPCVWGAGDKKYCNPGSVGQPRDGDPRAAFALWDRDSGVFTLQRVRYNYVLLQTAMKQAGFEPYFYENLSRGTRIGGKVDSLPDLG